MNGKMESYEKGPALILSEGSVDVAALTAPNRFGKYSVIYCVGGHNRSWQELSKIYMNMLGLDSIADIPKFLSVPWRYDKKNELVYITASTSIKVAVMDAQKNATDPRKVRPNTGAKLNVKPAYYKRSEEVFYKRPSGEQGKNIVHSEGLTLMLNGVMLLKEDYNEAGF